MSVTFSCKFRSTFTTNSDEIKIISGEEIEGKLEEEGSWADAFKLEYTDEDFITKKVKNLSYCYERYHFNHSYFHAKLS